MPLKTAGNTRGERSDHSIVEFFWVVNTASRVALRQAHAVSRADWHAVATRAACGLPLEHEMIENIPSDGASPCGRCLAATAGIVGLESI